MTRGGIQGDQRIRIEIIAGTIVIVEVGRRVSARYIKQILCLVKGHRGPEIASAVLAGGWIRPPSVGAGLSVVGHDIETPHWLAVCDAERTHPTAGRLV